MPFIRKQYSQFLLFLLGAIRSDQNTCCKRTIEMSAGKALHQQLNPNGRRRGVGAHKVAPRWHLECFYIHRKNQQRGLGVETGDADKRTCQKQPLNITLNVVRKENILHSSLAPRSGASFSSPVELIGPHLHKDIRALLNCVCSQKFKNGLNNPWDN